MGRIIGYFIIASLFLILICVSRVNAQSTPQEDQFSDMALRNDVTTLLNNASSKGLIPSNIKDSIIVMISSLNLQSDTLQAYNEEIELMHKFQTGKLRELRTFLVKFVSQSEVDEHIINSMQSERLAIPLFGLNDGTSSMDKGAHSFYKNERGSRTLSDNKYDPNYDCRVGKETTDRIAYNLKSLSASPQFIRDLCKSDEKSLRVLGALLSSLNNGAQAQIGATSFRNSMGGLLLMPAVGGAPNN